MVVLQNHPDWEPLLYIDGANLSHALLTLSSTELSRLCTRLEPKAQAAPPEFLYCELQEENFQVPDIKESEFKNFFKKILIEKHFFEA